MFRTTGIILLSAGAITALAGCNSGASCAEGATKHAETGVCIKLPADYKLEDKANKAGDSSYISVRNPKTFKNFSIWLDKVDDLDKHAKIIKNMESKDLKLVASGDTPTKGKFFHFHNGPGNYDFSITLVPGKQHLYRCEIQNTPPEDAKPMVEACKTLSGP